MNRRNFISVGVGVAAAAIFGGSAFACPCKGIERLETTAAKVYEHKVDGKTVVVVPLLSMSEADALGFANDLCSADRNSRVFVVQNKQLKKFGVFALN